MEMASKISIVFIFTLSLFFSSCNIEADPISYGTDQCNYCKMNIVDKLHAAQYVTKKGKQYKFDAIECMINELADLEESDLAILLVSDYRQPGEMTDATSASYLISPNIKSPMGAFLSAFKEENEAMKVQKEQEGQLYNWTSIKAKIAKK